MAKVLRASVFVPASMERTWDLWLRAARYPQWQSGLVAVRDVSGPLSEPGTTYVLDHGPKMQREVRVLVAEPPKRHVIEQSGVGVRDETSATFEREGDGTRLTVVAYARLNLALRVLAALDRRSLLDREFQRELDRFADLARRTPPPARPGGVYLADAGTIRRHLTVLALDGGVIHVRVQPGYLKQDDRLDVPLRAPRPQQDLVTVTPIATPLRASIDALASGLPFLRRDGGHGVAHLALSLEAWADAAPREVGAETRTPDDLEAVAAWRIRSGPVVGNDADLDLAPLVTLQLGSAATGDEVWSVAKILRAEILRVHIALPTDRWPSRPDAVRPWSLELRPHDHLVPIGHMPVTRSTLLAAKPRFAGVTTLENDELEGYRMWREAEGGTFTTLEPAMQLAEMTLDAEE